MVNLDIAEEYDGIGDIGLAENNKNRNRKRKRQKITKILSKRGQMIKKKRQKKLPLVDQNSTMIKDKSLQEELRISDENAEVIQ